MEVKIVHKSEYLLVGRDTNCLLSLPPQNRGVGKGYHMMFAIDFVDNSLVLTNNASQELQHDFKILRPSLESRL